MGGSGGSTGGLSGRTRTAGSHVLRWEKGGVRGMGKDGQLGQRGWIRRRGGRVKRVLHFRVVDLGVLGARVSGARWVTARASYRESMFPIRVDARVVDLPARPRRRRRVTRERRAGLFLLVARRAVWGPFGIQAVWRSGGNVQKSRSPEVQKWRGTTCCAAKLKDSPHHPSDWRCGYRVLHRTRFACASVN